MIEGIPTPFHAARFVSLLKVSKNKIPGADKVENWGRFHTILSAVKNKTNFNLNSY